MRRPRILIDIDGCFANFIDGSLPWIKSIVTLRGGGPGRHLEITHNDIWSYRMEDIFALTPDEIKAWHSMIKQPGYCAAIPAYPDARKAIAELQELGDVHPVTFPWPKAPHWIIEREVWLQDQLGIDPSSVVYTSQKHLIAGDIFVEDTTKYLVRWKSEYPNGTTIRIERPYNKNEPFLDGETVSTFNGLIVAVKVALHRREVAHRALWDEK